MLATRERNERERQATIQTIRILPELTANIKTPVIRKPFLEEEEEDKRTFFQRYRLAIGVIVVLGVGAVSAIRFIVGSATTPAKAPALVLVSLPLPPPSPPVQTAPEKVEDQQTFQSEEHPEEEPPKPPDQPPIGTNIKGDGSSNAFSLGNSGGNGLGNNRSNSTRFGWYAGQVQTKVSEAIRNNRKTRTAELSVRARIWSDSAGRVTRASLAGSTGDAALDAALRDEVLTGLQLREPPPPGMPMPIVLQLTAKRPR